MKYPEFPTGSKYFACYDGYDRDRASLSRFMLLKVNGEDNHYVAIVTIEDVVKYGQLTERTITSLQKCRAGTMVVVGAGSGKYTKKWLKCLSDEEVELLRKSHNRLELAQRRADDVWGKIRAVSADLFEKHTELKKLIGELDLDLADARHQVLGTMKPHRPKRRGNLKWELLE
jgi:hypothetical protein